MNAADRRQQKKTMRKIHDCISIAHEIRADLKEHAHNWNFNEGYMVRETEGIISDLELILVYLG